MLLPYNVDRPARHTPYVTYALMAVNTFLFFVTVFISNVELPADRVEGRAAIEVVFKDPAKATAKAKEIFGEELLREIIKDDAEMQSSGGGDEASMDADDSSTANSTDNKVTDNKATESSAAENKVTAAAPADTQSLEAGIASLSAETRKLLAAAIVRREKTEDSFNKSWQIRNSGATYLMEPHYSALDLFAYRPGEVSLPGKLLGLLGSMFLHGDFMHILGNMWLLWVFGRAIEDALGPRVYLGAYLLCGIVATLLYHITTMQFAPESAQIPAYGASGAVMGVLGLFAPRFYRTPVRAYFMPIFLIATTVASTLLYLLTRDIGISSFFGIAIAGAILYANREKMPWATRAFPAAYFIAAFIAYSDIYPVIRSLIVGKGTDTGDGVAHWAHIGGFFFGMLYAVLIGSQKEGKQEFLLNDAEKAYDMGDMEKAILYSQNILEREPGNPNAYELMGKAAIKQSNEEEALDYLETAVENYLKLGEREKAAGAYLSAVEKYPLFILKPAVQLAVGNQMAKDFNFKDAAETLVKVPYTYPEASEGEVALLRGAQLYLQHLNQPQTAMQLLQHFWQSYPQSQWMPQAERAWKMAQHQIDLVETEELQANASPEAAAPTEPSRLRAQAVAPPLELSPKQSGGAPKKNAPPPPGGTPKK